MLPASRLLHSLGSERGPSVGGADGWVTCHLVSNPSDLMSSDLMERFRNMSVTTATRAPLYARLSASIADDVAVADLLRSAAAPQQLPVLLFAAVHYLLLGGLGRALAAHYPNLSPTSPSSDPYPAFRSFVLEHSAMIVELIATRSTQTNEVGRCAVFLPALGMLDDERGPLALVDVGTSAGLNLLLHRYSYHYQPGGTVGAPSAVHLECSTRGSVPVPRQLPRIAAGIGIDQSPIDVTDEHDVRWLEACVWPDQRERFERLVAALEMARREPPDVPPGDAIDDLSTAVTEAATTGHPVILNSWVLNYLTGEQRARYVATIDAIGAEIDLSWLVAESPALTPELPVPSSPGSEHLTVLSLAIWRDGVRTVQRLGTTHPHGFWLHWEPAT